VATASTSWSRFTSGTSIPKPESRELVALLGARSSRCCRKPVSPDSVNGLGGVLLMSSRGYFLRSRSVGPALIGPESASD